MQRIGTDILALKSLQTVGSSVPALYKHPIAYWIKQKYYRKHEQVSYRGMNRQKKQGTGNENFANILEWCVYNYASTIIDYFMKKTNKNWK